MINAIENKSKNFKIGLVLLLILIKYSTLVVRKNLKIWVEILYSI